MSEADEIVLDVVPIYVGEMYPTKEAIWHFRSSNIRGVKEEIEKNLMIEEIRRHFSDCNAVIILEKGKVIEVL